MATKNGTGMFGRGTGRVKIGMEFERLTVIGIDEIESISRRKTIWRCECKCGNQISVIGHSLLNKHSKSCGCLKKEVTTLRSTTHGQAKKGLISKEYLAWQQIKKRCTDEEGFQYRDYGGRGILICEEWENDFQAFFDHVGPAPSEKHSIDRVSNEKGYVPGNMRWATRPVQNRNKRNNQYIATADRVMCLTDWAKFIGIKVPALSMRIRKNGPENTFSKLSMKVLWHGKIHEAPPEIKMAIERGESSWQR